MLLLVPAFEKAREEGVGGEGWRESTKSVILVSSSEKENISFSNFISIEMSLILEYTAIYLWLWLPRDACVFISREWYIAHLQPETHVTRINFWNRHRSLNCACFYGITQHISFQQICSGFV